PVYGQTTSATNTLLALTGSPFSLVASGTVNFVNSSTTNQTIFSNLYLSSIAPFQLLQTGANRQVTATSSIGTNLLTGTLATINTTSPITGGNSFSVGGTLTIACATCVTSIPPFQWDHLTTFGTSTISTTTPMTFVMGFFASSTSVLANASTTQLT